MSDTFCPDCKKQTEVAFDHSAGDTVCTECGLVLEAHSVDETSEWRTFANESSDNDPVRVGGPTNPLLTDGGLSTVIAKPNGAQGEFLSSSLGRWQNRGSNPDRSLILAFRTIANMADRGCPSLLSSMFRGNGNPLPLLLDKVDIDHLPAEVLLGENMRSLKKLSIWKSPRLKSLQLHPSCIALEFLEIRNCEQLAVLEGLQFLDSLELLDISISRELAVTWCHKLREQEEGSGQTSPLLPPSLQNLSIWDLTDKLQSHLLSFLPSLVRLWVYNSPSLMSLQLGSCTALECLTVANCGSLSSLEGLQHIRGFKEFAVSDCPVLVPHLELVFRQPWSHGLCSQLCYLTIDDPSMLVVPICKRLTSLSWLTLGSYYFIGSKHIKRMVSLTKEHGRALQCLTSLRTLQIENCPNLLHLPADLYSLPCLAHLEITNCPGISKLPENDLPPSLMDLWVNGCSEELNEQCRMAAKNVVRVKIGGEYVN